MILDRTMTVAICDLCEKLGPSAESAKTLTGHSSIQTVEKLLPASNWIKTVHGKIICDKCIRELKSEADATKMSAATANKLVDEQRDAINAKGSFAKTIPFTIEINGWRHVWWEKPMLTKAQVIDLYATHVSISAALMREVACVLWHASTDSGEFMGGYVVPLEEGMRFTVQFPVRDSISVRDSNVR